jgi:rhodanese-related sulfurtransferase
VTPEQVGDAAQRGAIVLDMRPPKPFAAEHVPGALNIQFNRADLADRAEMALKRDMDYVVHAEPEPIAKAAVEILEGAGFGVLGHLEGGLKAWKAAGLPTSHLPVIDVDELYRRQKDYRIIDTREGFEYKYGHIPGAELMPWTEVWDRLEQVSGDRPVALVCGDQVRSSFAASLLLRSRRAAHLVFGGMVDWVDRGYDVEK